MKFIIVCYKKATKIILFLCIFMEYLYNYHGIYAGKNEKRLLQALFQDYNALERPVQNESDSLVVVVGMSIQQIVDLDEKMQVLRCSGWMDYGWNDYNLKWDPLEYGNITTIRVIATKIWTPDLLLYNSADDSFDASLKVNAVIEYTGSVKYLPPGMFKSTCQIDITNFPFDEQSCSLKFGSWTYGESKINLTALGDAAQLDSFALNGEWHLNGVDSYRESISYECCPEKYPFVLFTVKIRRRTLYFIFNLVFPCALISMMTVLGFALPPDSGEKIGLEITTILSIIFSLQLITGIIPESSQAVPKIAIYFASVMLICAISIVCNVFVLIFHHKNIKVHTMPPWIKKWICLRLAKLLRIKVPNECASSLSSHEAGSSLRYNRIRSETSEPINSKSLLANVIDERTKQFVLNDDFGILNRRSLFRNNSVTLSSSQTQQTRDRLNSPTKQTLEAIKTEMRCIIYELQCLTKKIKDDESEGVKALEWKFAAMVLDKLCLYVFGILTLVSTMSILFSSKNFFKLY